MANINEIANQFTTFYYQTFDTQRQNLTQLYRDASTLSFEGQSYRGPNDIGEKLVGLPFARIQHKVSTFDSQLADPSGSILVLVTGQLLIDDESNPQMFSQTFHLVPENGSYYVLNDIFRLNFA